MCLAINVWADELIFRISQPLQVLFLNTSEEINRRPDEYWSLVMDIATKSTLNRIIKCTQIMGRSEKDDLSAAQIMYPCMQCADIFFIKVSSLIYYWL